MLALGLLRTPQCQGNPSSGVAGGFCYLSCAWCWFSASLLGYPEWLCWGEDLCQAVQQSQESSYSHFPVASTFQQLMAQPELLCFFPCNAVGGQQGGYRAAAAGTGQLLLEALLAGTRAVEEAVGGS